MPAMPPELNKITFIDIETTKLDHDREVYEVGYILRERGKPDVETSLMILDCPFGWSNVQSLDIGRAYERHPRFTRQEVEPGTVIDGTEYVTQKEAADRVELAVRKSVIVGLVPDFDEHTLKNLLLCNGWPWAGHYHKQDAETAAIGYLNGLRAAGRTDIPDLGWPPYDTEVISQLLGVKPPSETDRHTGLGDARWARDMWDAATSAAR